MPVLALEALRFHYDSPYAVVFDGVELRIDTSWRCGLVGRNGRGKTTLLRLLAGEVQPQQGSLRVPVVPLRFTPRSRGEPQSTRDFVRESVAPFTAWEAEMRTLLAQHERGEADADAGLERYGEVALEYERLGGYTIAHRIEEEWDAMGLGASLLDRPHETLSGGERTRASIVALFLRDDGYALIDEPTNHLDREGRDRLARYLACKPGFLMASHDRALLDGSCDHFVAIERRRLRLHRGSYSSLRAQQALEEEHEERERVRLAREIRSLTQAARTRREHSGAKEKTKRGAYDKGYIGHRAAKLMKRALHSERRVDERLAEKQALLRIPEKKRLLKLRPASGPQTLLTVESLDIEIAGRTLVRGLDLRLRRGDRLAISGANGSGKSLLLATLAGERPGDGGRVTRPGPTRWCRAHQTPRWQQGQLSEHLREAGLDAVLYRSVLGVLGIEGDAFERPLESFSEGERKKADLACSFLARSDAWVWDEPLNYLDIESREQIEDVVLRDAPTLLFVEHDGWFCERVATRRLTLQGDAGNGAWQLS